MLLSLYFITRVSWVPLALLVRLIQAQKEWFVESRSAGVGLSAEAPSSAPSRESAQSVRPVVEEAVTYIVPVWLPP